MSVARIEVTKQETESPMGLLKRFNKKIQTSSILKSAKSIRYNSRPKSNLQKKKRALKRIERTKEYTRLAKLGKLEVVKKR